MGIGFSCRIKLHEISLQTEFIEMYVPMGVTEGMEYKIEIRFTY